jgi:hypothetical protein
LKDSTDPLPFQLVTDRGDTFGDELNYATEVLDLDKDTLDVVFQLVEPSSNRAKLLIHLVEPLRGLLSNRAKLLIHSVEPLRGLLPKRANLLIRPIDSLPQLIEPLCVLRPKGFEVLPEILIHALPCSQFSLPYHSGQPAG